MKPKTVGRSYSGMAAPPPEDPAGLLADSIILTLDGEKRVGDVGPGQRIITRDSGTSMVRSVTRRQVLCPTVLIRAGSLGDTRPDRDATLPAGQGVLVRDWRARALFGVPHAVAPASYLVDEEFIRFLAPALVTLCEIEFDHPQILYVDGLEVAGHITAAAHAIAA